MSTQRNHNQGAPQFMFLQNLHSLGEKGMMVSYYIRRRSMSKLTMPTRALAKATSLETKHVFKLLLESTRVCAVTSACSSSRCCKSLYDLQILIACDSSKLSPLPRIYASPSIELPQKTSIDQKALINQKMRSVLVNVGVTIELKPPTFCSHSPQIISFTQQELNAATYPRIYYMWKPRICQ
jgi:hypothetical protein